ncbi:tetratricopeptide repeat protein [Pseudodesulfovibrio portus]|uniref:Tetratricopeptide repeat protein n=1 Tax=Pseudodesulfovibrio portus TaxID=231439 RepID=A0ABN6RP57_9BACT|nr:tetratricopeptide repeat protein [Pseudodesulfovibrio portus]BDQ32596.1 hypothetical protein JCM14722_01380 [Pseudodesulfovibrio portus]
MGVHKREREIEEIKEHYIKKSSAILLVFLALAVGAFIGNAITMLYVGQQQQRAGATSQSAPAQTGVEPHEANPVALANLEKAAQADPTNAAKWVELGNFCFDHDLNEQAVTAYERALALKPMQVNVWSDLGVMYRRTGRFDKAVEAFGHAAALDKTHMTSRYNMGIVYLHDLNDKQAALKVWKDILAKDPEARSPSGQSLASMVQDLEK